MPSLPALRTATAGELGGREFILFMQLCLSLETYRFSRLLILLDKLLYGFKYNLKLFIIIFSRLFTLLAKDLLFSIHFLR